MYGLKHNPQAWFEKSSITISGIGFHRCHSVFIRHIMSGLVILTVYVDDILLTVSDSAGLVETSEYVRHHFVTNDMG